MIAKETKKTTAQALPPAAQLPDELLTVLEAASYLKVCKQTVYNLLTAGKLRAFYVGSVRRIPRAELLKYLGGGSAIITTDAAGDASAGVVGAARE